MRDNNDSDNDEGFVPTKVEIKADHKPGKNNKNEQGGGSQNRPLDFQPRYIFGDGIMRKQPSEVYARFGTYLPQPSPALQSANKIPPSNNNPQPSLQAADNPVASSARQPHKTVQSSGHPYQKYVASENYSLVYSRIKDRVCVIGPETDDFSANEVNLSKVLAKYDADYYSVLKGFEAGGKKDGGGKVPRDKELTASTKSHGQHAISQHNEHPSFRIRAHNNNQAQHMHPSQQNLTLSSNPIHNQAIHNFHHPHPLSQSSPGQQLQFDSKFESGNLLYAFKHKSNPHSYTLFIQNDTNSYGYNQWFYFSLRGMKAGTTYKFSIVNFKKKHSLFKQGMKLSVFSLIDSQNGHDGNGWRKMGNNIRYQKSSIKKASDKKFKFYSLSFQLEFPHEGDYVKIAMNIPYSYSRLIHHLKVCGDLVNEKNKAKEEHYEKSKEEAQKKINRFNKSIIDNELKGIDNEQIHWEMAAVGYSIANNAVPYLTISNARNIQPQSLTEPDFQIPNQPSEQPLQSSQSVQKKKAIILLARQHPGQTWSSFMMQQMLYTLAQNSKPQIQYLLDNYVFKVFPMVNVDGVIYGNFRCDLGGFDLNRNWRRPDKNLHPQVYAIKGELEKIAAEYQVECVLDLHGHSKQYNTFSYSCKNEAVSSRVLSLIISEINPVFHFPYCTFGLSKYKETTARAILYKLTGNENILTIENSFYGAKLGDKLLVYDPQTIGQLAQAILEGVQLYLSKSQKRIQCQEKVQKNIQEYLQYQREGQHNAVDSGSQSQPYIDQISIKQKIKKILPKSFKAIQSQLEQQQKLNHKKTSPVKKRQDKKPNSTNQNYKTLNPPKLKIVKKETEEDETNSQQAFIQRTSLTHYKRNSKELHRKKEPEPEELESGQSSRQGRISIQSDNRVVKSKVGDVGLPFYIREKSTLVPIKLKNDSLEIFKDAYNATKTDYESNLHKTIIRPSNKKVKILNQTQSGMKEQFPLLCVLSEQKKRQSQMQKTHHHIFLEEQQSQRQRQRDQVSTSLPPKIKPFVQNQKLQHLKKNNKTKNYSFKNSEMHGAEMISEKLKEKNHKDATLISKIWRQNFARYGKDLNVFFGGMKG